MLGVPAARRRALAAVSLSIAWIPLLFGAPEAWAIEVLDGRVQLHGFGEVQMRALSRDFDEALDLAQWYNILNLELEAEVAPNGFGPADRIEAFVRVEARYDCVWTRGCGMVRSASTYGNRAARIPGRLRDARDNEYSGVIPPTPPGVFGFRAGEPTTENVLRIGDDDPATVKPRFVPRVDIVTGDPITDSDGRIIEEPIPGEGVPGFDTLFAQRGADELANTADDPGIYTFGPVLGGRGAPYSFALVRVKGPPGADNTLVVGPWRPGSFIRPNALLIDRANPFRGAFAGATDGYRAGDPLDPELAALKALLVANGDTTTVRSLTDPALDGDATGDAFAGDWSGIIPCREPSGADADSQRSGLEFTPSCYPNLEVLTGAAAPGMGDPTQLFANVRVAFQDDFEYVDPSGESTDFVRHKPGGRGELPMRPAPDLPNLAPRSANPRRLQAQGLYVPSAGLRRELARGDLDGPGFNLSESERAWNRGQSQKQTKELKEAYLDIDWLESRLWTRIGKQNIVWGKTELFRTTDQFNPQDLALASLPTLEESRIALWALRAIYSFYDVGSVQDVRFEVAANFDEFQPADLGAAGEPFTTDSVGVLASSIFAHSYSGAGIAGVDRPDDPWDNIQGIEAGWRLEGRWQQFSFAVTHFYGYDDFPYANRIWTYAKSNDLVSSRPLVGGLVPGRGASLCSGPVLDRDGDGTIDRLPDPANGPGATRAIIDSKSPQSYTLLGVGADPGCLKGGGAAGGVNRDPWFGGDQNALENHHVNQQLFAWVCSMTISIGASLDPGSCAWNLFGSPDPLAGTAIPVPFVEMISGFSAGDRDSRNLSLVNNVITDTKPSFAGINRVFALPTSPLNGDPGPADPDCPLDVGDFESFSECALWDGVITMTSTLLNRVNDAVTSHTITYRGQQISTDCRTQVEGSTTLLIPSNVGPLFVRQLREDFPDLYDLPTLPGICGELLFHHETGDLLSLDSTLNNFQKALLGCGAFYGTRCDAATRLAVLPDGTVVDGSGDGIDEDAEAIQALEDSMVLLHPEGGGIDVMNAEASALMQSWPGVEGTAPRGSEAEMDIFWTMFGRRRQPGTARVVDALSFEAGGHEQRDFGPSCTRPDGAGGLVVLPGCRGIETIFLTRDPDGTVASIGISFDDGYRPGVDGCLVGGGARRNGAGAIGNIGGIDVMLLANANGYTPDSAEIERCHTDSYHRFNDSFENESTEVAGSSWLWHPVAGCLGERRAEALDTMDRVRPNGTINPRNQDPETGQMYSDCGTIGVPASATFPDGTRRRTFIQRFADLNGNGFQDIEDEFVGTLLRIDDGLLDPSDPDAALLPMAQMFESEMAAFSYNFLVFLVVSSCSEAEDGSGVDGNIRNRQECFDPNRSLRANKCSFNAPHLCRNVKGFLNVTGVTRNDLRAGGNPRFGRRTFIWHSGGEVVLRYERRNVLGFSMDFAEDWTKSNWSTEFTWVESQPFADHDRLDGIRKSDVVNLTVSVDRPTFVNFLNANRTFFINSQWFLQYVPGYRGSFPSNGPWNLLFTFTVSTGYFQDRLEPSFTSVFDVQSRSGGLLPSISYRFTESLSATIGANIFFGRTQRTRMPLSEIGPVMNRAPSPNDEGIAYRDGVDNNLSQVRKRDELYLRLRWAF